jgi:hypothetical protein
MAAALVPCEPWTTSAEVVLCPDCAPDTGEFEEDLLVSAADAASAWLFRLTAYMFPGACTATVRPMWLRCDCGSYGWGYGAPMVDSYTAATNTFWCGCRYGNRRENVNEITLGYFPVTEILEVTVDGVPLAVDQYRLDDNRWLVATHGNSWPKTQDLTLSPGEVGTWTVQFSYGLDPPIDGRLAARVLACEVARWLKGGDCRIPKRATNIARQGVSVALIDPSGLLENGRFGIPEVDAFLNSVNPHRLQSRPGISNIDIGRPSRLTTSLPGS